mgnify:CR=1 FL=1
MADFYIVELSKSYLELTLMYVMPDLLVGIVVMQSIGSGGAPSNFDYNDERRQEEDRQIVERLRQECALKWVTILPMLRILLANMFLRNTDF